MSAAPSVVEQHLAVSIATWPPPSPIPSPRSSTAAVLAWSPVRVELESFAHGPQGPWAPDPCTQEVTDPVARELASLPGGPALAARLERPDVRGPGLSEAVRLELVAAHQRLVSYWTGQQAQVVADLERDRAAEAVAHGSADPVAAERGHARSFAADELAARLRVSPAAGQALVERAVALTGPRRALLAALTCGLLSVRRAEWLLEQLVPLPASVADRVEAAVLPGAAWCCQRTLRRRVARAVHRADPDAAEHRAEQVHADRGVRTWADADGRETLQLTGSAVTVAPLREAIDARARAMRSRATDEQRATTTLDQWRADAATDIAHAVLEGDHGPVSRTAASRPVVHLTMPLGVATGTCDGLSELRGHGLVPPSVARRILADGIWRRILTDPVTGVAVHTDEKTYHPSVGLRRLVIERYQVCCHEGCGQPAWRCEPDHTPAWPEGRTSAATMHPRCKYHHLVRHSPLGMTVTMTDDGTVTTTGRAGHVYETRPVRIDGLDDDGRDDDGRDDDGRDDGTPSLGG